jgi:hypothetical protein
MYCALIRSPLLVSSHLKYMALTLVSVGCCKSTTTVRGQLQFVPHKHSVHFDNVSEGNNCHRQAIVTYAHVHQR